ncbi:tautomerase family protein [Thermus thermophilus]|uniref:tautomerase family protein n=1 Tax=Thermus thermophilus TaxID=274 RepID=UPI0003A359C2|nr:tautomerase family protein [Thermus thermophilus]BBL83388.1 4-oxalocrotonate tautomerase [Thermus thermophilus]BBL85661.1 4-oxalocrotonate tautomerase [Thermus thermophilus]
MVVLKVTMLEGRPPEKKRELVRRLTEMASRLLGEPYEEVRVILYEVRRDQWAAGGVLFSDKEGT